MKFVTLYSAKIKKMFEFTSILILLVDLLFYSIKI